MINMFIGLVCLASTKVLDKKEDKLAILLAILVGSANVVGGVHIMLGGF